MPSGNTHTFKALHNHQLHNRRNKSESELKKNIKSIGRKIEKLNGDLFDLNVSYKLPYKEKRLKRLTIIEEIDKLEMERNKQKESLRMLSMKHSTIGGSKSKKMNKTKKTRKNRTRKEKLTFMSFISNLM